MSICSPRLLILSTLLTSFPFLLSNCASSTGTNVGSSSGGPPNMGGPSLADRNAKISTEATGNFFYGRRYFVNKTRFWGYLRKPRQSASKAQLVIFDERSKRSPDRFSETGPSNRRYAFDNNFEYRIYGDYTGGEAYDPNSNQFLPVFRLTNYELIDRQPGWLFSPQDHYNPNTVSLRP